MGALLASIIFGLAAFVCYKMPFDWYVPFLRWWKSEEDAKEIQHEVKWANAMFFGGIAVLCLGIQLIQWWTHH